jgi:acetoin utilization protein AcuB
MQQEHSSRDPGTLPVAEVMARPVVTATPLTPVSEARQLMRAARVRHLPVLEGELLVGIVSDRDLRQTSDATVAVGAIMARPVFVLAPDTSLRTAARIFLQRRFGAMPVLDGRNLVGMVSVVDLLSVLGE